MAERINWRNVDRDNPLFFEADTANPNKNISAAKYDPTDPTAAEGSVGARYNEFLRTANVGDTFDWGDGTQNKFTGFNKMGTPMITTIQSEARTNWRDTMANSPTFQDAVNKLKAAGFSDQEASYLVRQSGTTWDTRSGSGSSGTTKAPKPGTAGASSDAPVGTPPAFVYNSATGQWVQPAKPTTAGTWVWDNIEGWVDTTVNPGATGLATGSTSTLAKDTFKNTLALFFGAGEMSQAWVDSLYKVVTGYVNTGSDVQEALNLSLQDARNNPVLKPFTDRFKGVYALQDRLAKGEAVSVPTIAEYFKTQEAMGDTLRNVGLGELATQDFLGDVLGRGKSLLEVTNLVDNVFNAIDNAPAALKKDLQDYFPGVDRTSIAKALLTGTQGWAELDKKVKSISVLSAAKSQGITVDMPTATDLALLGTDYAGALSGFQQVKELERGKFLGKISGIDLTQEEAIGATFKKNAAALTKIEDITKRETARYAGSSGRLASRERGTAGLF